MDTIIKKAFFDCIYKDLQKSPPDVKHLTIIIKELYEALCKFVPSKKAIHQKIKGSLLIELNLNNMTSIINSLIYWIEQFQPPAYDKKTKQWRENFKKSKNYSLFIVEFLKEYFNHLENIYKEVWDARKRLVNNENIVPPEHRVKPKGKNNIPDVIKSGK